MEPIKAPTNDTHQRIAQALLCSGKGQFHTNEIDLSKPDKQLTAYETITLNVIQKMADKPQSVDKKTAKWLIPSTLPSHNFKAQEDEGTFWILIVDCDESPLPIHMLKKQVISIIGNCQYEIYTSRSAT